MFQNTFDLIAQIMRYWFAALAVYILFRVVRSVWSEFSRERSESKQATGEYAMGILEIIASRAEPKLVGTRYALRQENKIGRSSSCDIRIKERSVRPMQAMIYQKGNQILLSDYGSSRGVFLNGQRVREDVALLNGDEIRLSNVVLSLHLRGGTPRTTTPDHTGHQAAYGAGWPYQRAQDRRNDRSREYGRENSYHGAGGDQGGVQHDTEDDEYEYGEYIEHDEYGEYDGQNFQDEYSEDDEENYRGDNGEYDGQNYRDEYGRQNYRDDNGEYDGQNYRDEYDPVDDGEDDGEYREEQYDEYDPNHSGGYEPSRGNGYRHGKSGKFVSDRSNEYSSDFSNRQDKSHGAVKRRRR